MDIFDTFTKCLGTISYSRAGWDYQMSPEQRKQEQDAAETALSQARAIWAANPDKRDELIDTFMKASPLASLTEITS